MADQKKPLMVIIAGPNGSGKTTLAPFFLKKMGIKEFINTDEIARGLSPYNAESQAVSAGKLALKRMSECLAKKTDFAVETTLAGNHLVKYISRAHKAGYRTLMIYLFTEDVEINVLRIANRKKQGGHFVATTDVKRRYLRSINNLFKIFSFICNTIEIYNCHEGSPQFVATGGITDGQPIWSVRADQSAVWEKMSVMTDQG